jgi:hypothetical protein
MPGGFVGSYRGTMTDSDGGRTGERAGVDLRVQDPAFLEEIDLYSELIIVAAASPDVLTTDAIDQALGLRSARAS